MSKIKNNIMLILVIFTDILLFILGILIILDTHEKVVLGITMMITIAGLLSLICSYPKYQKYIKEHYLIFDKSMNKAMVYFWTFFFSLLITDIVLGIINNYTTLNIIINFISYIMLIVSIKNSILLEKNE